MIVSEMKFDESIYQDFILDDENVSSIDDSVYSGHVEIYEGRMLLLDNVLDVGASKDRYEMRISKDTLEEIFENGHVYDLRVYEENTTTGYKQYIHEEKIKVRF